MTGCFAEDDGAGVLEVLLMILPMSPGTDDTEKTAGGGGVASEGGSVAVLLAPHAERKRRQPMPMVEAVCGFMGKMERNKAKIHSYRSASMGRSFAAWYAGSMPKKMPTPTEKAKARMTEEAAIVASSEK